MCVWTIVNDEILFNCFWFFIMEIYTLFVFWLTRFTGSYFMVAPVTHSFILWWSKRSSVVIVIILLLLLLTAFSTICRFEFLHRFVNVFLIMLPSMYGIHPKQSLSLNSRNAKDVFTLVKVLFWYEWKIHARFFLGFYSQLRVQV